MARGKRSDGPDGKPGKPAQAAAPTGQGDGGLLVSQPGKLVGRKFMFAIFMEFLCTGLFTLFGNAAPSETAAVGNGLMLAVTVYIAANVSGGHLNPAVTAATLVTGHISIVKGALYIVAQIFGAIIFTLLTVGLTPLAAVGETNGACFIPGTMASKGQAFGWELFMTFTLVSTVYAVAIGKPSFGNVGPLIIGIALWACATSAGQYTTASLNPARTLGPAAVFHCGANAWYYVIAEFLGGLLAGFLSWPLYGREHTHLVDSEFTIDPEEEDDEIDMEEERHENAECADMINRQNKTKSARGMLQDNGTRDSSSAPGLRLAEQV